MTHAKPKGNAIPEKEISSKIHTQRRRASKRVLDLTVTLTGSAREEFDTSTGGGPEHASDMNQNQPDEKSRANAAKQETGSISPSSSPTPTPTPDAQQKDNGDTEERTQFRLYIPREYYLVPLSTTTAGLALGFLRGARLSSLRYLAENAHRAPRTLEEWYFYHKTKNYRVLLGGLKASGREGVRLGAAGCLWVGIERGMEGLGREVGEWREVGAGAGLAGVVALVCEYPKLGGGLLGEIGYLLLIFWM